MFPPPGRQVFADYVPTVDRYSATINQSNQLDIFFEWDIMFDLSLKPIILEVMLLPDLSFSQADCAEQFGLTPLGPWGPEADRPHRYSATLHVARCSTFLRMDSLSRPDTTDSMILPQRTLHFGEYFCMSILHV
jgi:hypothetical protein